MKTVKAWAVKIRHSGIVPFCVERTRSECIDSAIKWAHGELGRFEKRSTVWQRLKRKWGLSVVPVIIQEVESHE